MLRPAHGTLVATISRQARTGAIYDRRHIIAGYLGSRIMVFDGADIVMLDQLLKDGDEVDIGPAPTPQAKRSTQGEVWSW
ncbi:MAG TPA: hypothetical protein PKE32_05435 [Miltoncostaeaceae bacterium]|nr:hypothetical protein [Miltoncostaeaceae bacterium]